MYWGRHLVKMLKAVEILARPGGATMEEMAEQLEVERRTAYRIRETLEELNFPLYEDASGLDGRKRYRFEETYLKKLPNLKIPELNLSLPEIVALYFIRSNSRPFRGTDIERNIEAAFTKMDAFVPDELSKRLEKVKTLFVSTNRFAKDYRGKEVVIDALTEAILRQQTCLVEYHSFYDDQIKGFKIDPLRFFERDGGLYIFVRATTFDHIIVLAVERIHKLMPTDTTFSCPEDFDPEELLDGAFGIIYNDPIKVRIRFASEKARYIRERQWVKNQAIIDQPDGSLILEMQTSSWMEVKKWVLSFGPLAEVLEPVKMRDELYAAAQQMVENYRTEHYNADT